MTSTHSRRVTQSSSTPRVLGESHAAAGVGREGGKENQPLTLTLTHPRAFHEDPRGRDLKYQQSTGASERGRKDVKGSGSGGNVCGSLSPL